MLGYARHGLDLLEGGFAHALDATEVLEELLAALGTQTGNIIEDGGNHALVAQLAMEGDGEAVGLVAYVLDEVQRGTAAGQHDGTGVVPGHVELLVLLGQTRHRDVETEFGKLVDGGGELWLAAIEDEQVGAAAKTFVFHALGRVAAAQHLAHHREVVCLPVFLANLEASVLRLVGLAAREDDHRRDGVVAVDGRDVEALDAHGRLGQR